MTCRLNAVLALAFLVSTGLVACQPADSNNPGVKLPVIETLTKSPTVAQDSDTTSSTLPSSAGLADLIFFNGSVLTMDPSSPRGQALAVSGEKIVAVGTDDEIMALKGTETRLIDLQGRSLLPGFIDAHTHLLNDHEALGTDLLGAQELALRNGITTLANLFSTEDFVQEMQVLEQTGELILRTSLYLAATDNCGEPTDDWWKAYPVSNEPGEHLRIGGLKIFADGGTCGKLAGSQELLPGYGLGDLFFSQQQMDEFLSTAQAVGYPLAIHAQGDRAIEQALNSFANVLQGQGNPLRHRIEHNALVRPEQRPLYSELDVVATLFGYQTICDMPDWTDFYIAVDEDLRAMLDSNPEAHFAWHGDDPWLPPISPLLELASMVTRMDRREDGSFCEPPPWQKDKAISVEEGLQLMTMGSAYALFRENEVGSLTPGKYADLLVLNDDPTAVEPVELWDLQLLMTIVGGEVVYCAESSASLCEPATASGVETVTPGEVSGGILLRASNSLAGSPPELTQDGLIDDTPWVSGGDAPQWIELDLGTTKHVIGLRIWVDQYPSGFTRHRILGGDLPNPTEELAVLASDTSAGQLIEVEGDWSVRYLRIETVESPSWVAWFEIEVLSNE